MTSLREQASVLALVEAADGPWYRTAALLDEAGSAELLFAGDWASVETMPRDAVSDLVERVDPHRIDEFEGEIKRLESDGIHLLTVLDHRYPANLREVYNRPPFLFVMGSLESADDRSVAIVGTRTSSAAGLEQATWLSSHLAKQGITVLSGLARGIDTAAHTAALDVGGRTVAVLGHGITHDVYPRENEPLARRIRASGGAIVSQFWPAAPPTRTSFPMRNVVMSGLGIGTVVIEASGHSGAKMQARLCLEHGKRLFLVESLVMQEDWARKYAERPGVTVVRDVKDIVDVLVAITEAPEQLVLC